ncbi:hypothetical protein ACFQJ5_01200 [Halomicroarcula sp. GCM10025324]|uniref:hypothetical protein n=1 Tax=Halomicroarcula sp. GCM10025324 TaxID=3252667 RepID=UPI00360E3581
MKTGQVLATIHRRSKCGTTSPTTHRSISRPLDRSEYDIQTYEDEEKEYYDGSDWFDLHNIELTAIIRVPVLSHEFASDGEGEVQGPYYDWTVVTLRLSALEYLESMLFNSPATQKLLNPAGEYSVGDGVPYTSKEVTDKENFGCSVLIDPTEYILAENGDFDDRIVSTTSHVAQEADPAADYFFYGALHELFWEEEFAAEDLRKVNPIKFCVGRGMSRRWGEAFSEALEAKPYADRFESLQYQKLTTLKAFVGKIDYDFQADVYQNTPEETVVNMYLSATTDEYAGADCVTASMFFTGVAYWMTGCHPVMVLVQRVELSGHFWAGLHDIDMPDLSHLGNLPVAGYSNLETEPHEARQFEYTYTDVECTEGYPSIGFDRPSLNSSRRHIAWSNLEPLSLTTHLPLNDEWEPDVDGEVRAPDEGSFRNLKANPFEMNVIYHFEEE